MVRRVEVEAVWIDAVVEVADLLLRPVGVEQFGDAQVRRRGGRLAEPHLAAACATRRAQAAPIG